MPQPQGPEANAKQRARMRGLAKNLHDIATSDEFLDAVEEVRLDPVKRGRLKANPRAYLQRKGVKSPRNVDVDLKEGASWLVCFYYYYWYYRVRYCYYVS